MALETVRVSVGPSAYVVVATNVTACTITENLREGMRIHIVATGGSSPAVDADYQHWDGEYIFSGAAADIYVLSPNGSTSVGVVRS